MIRSRRVFALLVCLSIGGFSSPAAAWRSALYPSDWVPGYADGQGRFLHDFSFAGYHRGEAPIPESPPGLVYDVTQAPFNADATGVADATGAIQAAIDAAGNAGGGIVYLPAGTYRVKPPGNAIHALYIGKSGVVLRGAGRTQTFIFNDAIDMRERRIINVRPDPNSHYIWQYNVSASRALASDHLVPTDTLQVVDVTGYAPGDWLVVRADPTAAFIAEHGMTGVWDPNTALGPIFYRQVVAVDANTNTITIDVPTRYPLKLRDNARINKTSPHLSEIGIEHLSIGNRQNPTGGTGDNDYSVPGTGAYQMHASFGIYFNHVVNGWIRDVASYRPTVNGSNVHLLSSGLRLDASRFVTVADCDFRSPQYKGNGGNGYMFVMTGSENLMTRLHAEAARHSYTFGMMYVSGNVLHRSTGKDSRLPVDFHMLLSMANLIDNMSMDNDSIEAVERTCCGHGHSTTQSVIWNTNGIRYPSGQIIFKFIVESEQFGHGYVIGTRGAATSVRIGNASASAPTDFSEGIAQGDSLEPASLYEDQLARRIGPVEPPPGDAGPGGADGGSTVEPDAGPGAGDGGAAADSDAGIGEEMPSGCGCASGAGDSAAGLWLIGLVALPIRRRRTK